jgi:trimethylamine--corrinoid protein Co-methyltransferase
MINSYNISHMTPGLTLLSEPQKAEIHSATLELLRRTGVQVRTAEVRDLLAQAGGWVEGNRVRLPAHLIDWAIRVAPKRVVLCDRAGQPAMYLEGRKSYYGTGSDTVFVIDAYTGARRRAVLADIANVSRLVDALPNISFIMCMGIAADVTDTIADVYHFREMVSHTSKPIVYTAWNRQNLEDIVAMAETVAGGAEALRRSPFCALYSEPIGPLVHAEESCEKLLYICRKGLPVVYTPGLITGASAPVTRAGAVVQANAELLSGLLICQLIREGTPVVASGGGLMAMDMSTTLASYGAPEFMLDLCALSEMGHYYNLPVFGFAGVSDAKLFDEQASIEGALWMLLAALSGGNLIHDVGYIEAGLTTSYEMLVAMDEVAGLVRRFMDGVEINQDSLALDVIDRVGPGGHFLEEDHTFRHFRHNWFPRLLDRKSREDWEAAGSLTMRDRAVARVRTLLDHHQSPSLPASISTSLEAIIQRAEARVAPARG